MFFCFHPLSTCIDQCIPGVLVKARVQLGKAETKTVAENGISIQFSNLKIPCE